MANQDLKVMETLLKRPNKKLLNDFVRLTKKIRKLESELKQEKNKLKEISADKLLSVFTKNGIQNIVYDGVTIYIKRDTGISVVRGVPKEKAVEVLKANNLEDFVEIKPDTSGLKKYFTELVEQEAAEGKVVSIEEVIPEPLQPIFKAFEDFKLQARTPRGSAAKSADSEDNGEV